MDFGSTSKQFQMWILEPQLLNQMTEKIPSPKRLFSNENSKTTEMYIRVTTKEFNQIKSPLEQLDLED